MVTQLRSYRIRDGELDRFVDEWRAHLAPLRRACGFEIRGAWTVPTEDRFVWLLAHPGDWDAFEVADAESSRRPSGRPSSPTRPASSRSSETCG